MQALKTSLTERLLEVLYAEVPSTRGKVTYTELGTPLSNNTYLGAIKGEIYGVPQTPSRFRLPWLRPR